MKIVVIQINNKIIGLDRRLNYIDRFIGNLINEHIDLVILPELSTSGICDVDKLKKYGECENGLTYKFAIDMCNKYNIYIGLGFIEKKGDVYFNSYILAGKDKVYGICRKNKYSFDFIKTGNYKHIIEMPFGKVGVLIGSDIGEDFIEEIKDSCLIINPSIYYKNSNYKRCEYYLNKLNIPLVSCNHIGLDDKKYANGQSIIFNNLQDYEICFIDEYLIKKVEM